MALACLGCPWGIELVGGRIILQRFENCTNWPGFLVHLNLIIA